MSTMPDPMDIDAYSEWCKAQPPTIPPITDERLHELAARIKPVIKLPNGKYKEMKPNDEPLSDKWLKNTAFTWEPKTAIISFSFTREVVREVETFHNWGYYGFFKPSLKEVFAALQDQDLEGVTHIHCLGVVDERDSGGRFLFKPDGSNIDGYHKARIHLLRAP